MRPARRLTLACCLAVFALRLTGCRSEPGSEDRVVGGPAPDTLRVAFETSRGTFVVEAIRAWAPNGADRFHQLVQNRFFDDARVFRVVPGFIAQFGINGDRKRNERWGAAPIPDDPVLQSNGRATVVFTNAGPDTRSHQIFVNLADNPRLDQQRFAPFGRVIEGMSVVDSLYGGYGEAPQQHLIQALGNSYLARMFPRLDHIVKATILEPRPGTLPR